METLTTDNLGQIFKLTPIPYIRNSCIANKELFPKCLIVLNNNIFWKQKLKYDFNIEYDGSDEYLINYKTIYAFLYYNPKYENDLNKAFIDAAKNGSDIIIKILLKDDRVNVSKNNNPAIIDASSHNNTNVVKLLLGDDRTDPSIFDNIPLLYAVKNKNIEMIKLFLDDKRIDLLLDYKINLDPIVESIKLDNVEIFKLFVDKGLDPSDSYLIDAIKYGSKKITEYILSDKRVKFSDDRYEIKFAITRGTLDVIKLLIKDERFGRDELRYSLIVASGKGTTKEKTKEIIKEILKDDRITYGMIYDGIVESSKNGNLEALKVFINDNKALAKLNTSKLIETAIGNGHKDVARFLLDSGKVRLTQEQKDTFEKKI